METKALMLRKNFYWTGILDEGLRVFDIIMETEFGTTYNSYVYKAGEQVILFETVKGKFFEEYRRELEALTDVRNIDYLVLNHTEPDHAGSVERLLELNPQMKILATGTAITFLKHIVNRDFCSIAVKDGQEMKISGITLRFLHVPNLHWPDTMYTYLEEEQALVTCDSFGAHYAFSEILSSKLKNQADYWKAVRYYFDGIISPFKPFMKKALERIEGMDITMICTGHGPVLDTGIEQMLNVYKGWCDTTNPNDKKTVVIPYVSAYGYTRQLAEQIEKGIRESGELEVRMFDMVEADAQKVLEEINFADGILFGTPTILGEALKPVWELVISMVPPVHRKKLAGAFGSYGWSGEAVPHITERLRQLSMRVEEGFSVRLKPDETDLLNAYEYGYRFGCRLLDKEVPGKKKGKASLVKCLVCGEIFDSSVEICPVCGVGPKNFVPVEEQETGYRRDTQNFYAVIGNGAAGISAIKAIRERDHKGSVYLISNEEAPAYNRPMLTKSLVAGLRADEIAIQERGWYERLNISQMLGKEVTAIDTKKKEIHTADGGEFKYTRLIYALGAECFIPPIPGTGLPEAIAIRRLSDTEKVTALLKNTRDVAVIGGGVLGLEAAWEMRKAGCHVTVLELGPRLMGRQLDEEAGEMLRDICKEQGVEVFTDIRIDAIEGEAHVTGVRLGDGKILPAQLVILSCGVRANIAIAKKAGLAVEQSVVVDSQMRTSARDVFACGDCAQYEGLNYAVWTQAVEQGRIAGANAAGEPLEYTPVPAALTFHGMHTELFSIGDNGSNPSLIYKTAEFKDSSRRHYEKYYFRSNQLCGAILLGDISKMAEVAKAVERRAEFGEMFGRCHTCSS